MADPSRPMHEHQLVRNVLACVETIAMLERDQWNVRIAGAELSCTILHVFHNV